VHPAKESLAKTLDPQVRLDEINRCVTLLYQIVFFLIGYEGMFTDYGQHGWPLVQYPLAVSEAGG
jgi:hypothetical protein